MTLTGKKIRQFHGKIFSWWERNKRDLPWRHTRDPYRILIAEVMLQQTQVSRVLPKYEEFLIEFPDVYRLARATPARVLMLWKGMGYNRRALYLKRTAETVVAQYNGVFPDDERLLTKLPGLGLYTARALLVFAFEKDVAMVDTNIRQIITHYFFDGAKQKDKTIQTIADTLVPRGRSWAWHQALMDYGSLAMPKIRPRTPTKRKHGTPFRDSDRYFRGRILDVLREGSVAEDALPAQLIDTYGKDREFFERIITGLIRDGLVERRKRMITLPS